MRNSLAATRFCTLAAVAVASLAFARTTVAQAPVATAADHTGVHKQPTPSVSAVRLTAPVTIDGNLDEDVWKTAPVATNFRQSQPNEGQPATQKTEVRFAYDEEAIYVGARMFETEGAKGVHTRLLRRDALSETDSDILQVIF